MQKEKANAISALMAMLDVGLALISFNLAIYSDFGQFSFLYNKDSIILQLLVVIIWTFMSTGFKTNILYRSRPYSMVLFNVVGQVFLGTTLLILSVWTFNLFYLGVSHFLIFAIINLALTFSSKSFIYFFLKKARKRGYNSLNMLVIADVSGRSFIRQLIKHPEWGYRIHAIIGPEELRSLSSSFVPLLPEETDVEQLLRNKTIDEVVFCRDNTDNKYLEEIIDICADLGVVFRMYSSFFNMLTNRTQLQYFGTTPLLTISSAPMDYVALKTKRIFDYVFSAAVLFFLSPVYLGIAVAIKLDSPGKVFFKQKRVGLRGRQFYVYKFRTMVSNAEELRKDLLEQNEMDGPVFKITRDPRITRVGNFLRKTSLDELPQFMNVLRGEMSVIGPRPPIPEEVEEYERWQLRRLSMRPGITCIWQVSGRNDIPFEEWMKMDMEYIDNWSLKLDFVLLLKTIRTVLKSDGR